MKTRKKQKRGKKTLVKAIIIVVLLYAIWALLTTSKTVTIYNTTEPVQAEETDEYVAPDPCTLEDVVCDYEKDDQRDKIEQYFKDHRYDRIEERMANYDRAKAILSQSWDSEKVSTMLAIMAGESKFDQNAKGDTHIEFAYKGEMIGHSCGLAQIRVLPARYDIGANCEYLQNPENNVKYAMQMVDRYQRFTDWTVYNEGIYLQFK